MKNSTITVIGILIVAVIFAAVFLTSFNKVGHKVTVTAESHLTYTK